MKMTALLVAFAFAMLSGVMPVRADPLVNPAPIAVPSGLDQSAVHQAIKQALMYRNWMISAQQPGRVDATLYLRGNEARIRIDYDRTQVRVTSRRGRRASVRRSAGSRRSTTPSSPATSAPTCNTPRVTVDLAQAARRRTAAIVVADVAAWRLRGRVMA